MAPEDRARVYFRFKRFLYSRLRYFGRVGSGFIVQTKRLSSEIIVSRNKWIHLAMSWKRGVSGKLKLYANGEKKFEATVNGNVNLDFRNSGGSVYNIGLRIDIGDALQAYLSDLVIFNRELPEHELFQEWVQSHSLHNTLFS